MVGRLFQIVYMLMEQGSITAKDLADKLEVSVRTINRDIEKLSGAGIPIYTTQGRSGGISLLPDFVLNKKVLTDDEKSAILSSMKLMGTVAYDDEKEAISRLENFFGKSMTDWIEIDIDSWGQGKFDKDIFRDLKGAILKCRKVKFIYSKRGGTSNRVVCPYRLIFRSQSWYVYGFCEERKDFRYFKFHRISNLIVTGEKFEKLELPKEEKVYYENREPEFDATVEINKSQAYRVYDEIPPDALTDRGDKLVWNLKGGKMDWFFPYVLSYGADAEVIEPVEVRNMVLNEIRKMYGKYNE